MDSDRWQRVKDVLHEALALAEPERRSLLDRLEREDPALAAEIVSLLAAHAEAETFIETPALAETRALDALDNAQAGSGWIGRRLGPYVVERELGHGGMGTVYLASRADDEYKQRVAIKVVRGYMAGDAIRRFRRERQILADLNHPNIARLIGGGTLDDGSPYVVMEYIEGLPIDQYCDGNRLTIPARLALFQQVCAAVHYAHQHLVVHRDLKPGNILVTSDGVPKLLDFGIAKLIDTDGAAEVTATRLMTLESASPEQVRGEPITTATDVYALGVMLYGLLTGQSPYALPAKTPHELTRAICEVDPEAPSAVVARVHGGTVARHERWRDLDAVTLKALHKEPERRYPGADQLAADLQRHLEGQLVLAAPSPFSYRARKFIARHRAAVIAAAAVSLALVGGIVTTAWQARIAREERARAERRFNDVRKLARTMIFEMYDAVAALPGSTNARKLLVTSALEYLDGLGLEAEADVSLQREVATAYERVADVQGLPNEPNLGGLAGALETYRKAQAIRERLGAASEAADPALRRELSTTALKLTQVYWFTGSNEASAAQARLAVAIEESAFQTDQGAEQRGRLAAAYDLLGYTIAMAGKSIEALEHFKRATDIVTPVATPEHPEQYDLLSTISGHMADIFFQGEPVPGLIPDVPAALELFRKELAINEALRAADPKSVLRQRNVMVGLIHVADTLVRLERTDEAMAQYKSALAIAEAQTRDDPADMQSFSDQALVYADMATLLVGTGDAAAAIPLLERARTMLERVSTIDPENLMTRSRMADVQTAFGRAYLAFASDPGNDTAARIDRYRLARAELVKAHAFWQSLKDKGTTTGEQAKLPDELARDIAGIDREMKALDKD